MRIAYLSTGSFTWSTIELWHWVGASSCAELCAFATSRSTARPGRPLCPAAVLSAVGNLHLEAVHATLAVSRAGSLSALARLVGRSVGDATVEPLVPSSARTLWHFGLQPIIRLVIVAWRSGTLHFVLTPAAVGVAASETLLLRVVNAASVNRDAQNFFLCAKIK